MPVCFLYKILISLLIFDQYGAQVPLAEYQCGTDITTRFLSNLMTSSCDQIGINVCCIHHDECYSSCALSQLSCDATFCNCIAALDASIYCRNVVYAWHCNAVQWLGDRFICPPMGQPLFGG
ncbi:hypothetical protein OSTOST_19919 [Ostertagia ostertagi]